MNSDSYQEAIGTLPPDIRGEVVRVAEESFSLGVADAMGVTAVLTLLAAVVVFFVWPRRARRAPAGALRET
ncbi:hypothetical protein [Streptomyces radiopugnans]|uniref:hypothetical protein n=1 Tax=Streptomyces radiopugnans TaxID=403935 RepID=UPI003F1A59C9